MSDETALARWSRRKQAAAAPATPPLATTPQETPTSDAPDDAVPPPPDLPDVESLTAESDYTAFMQAGVPEDLKRLALRKLWRSNPIFANLDGMNDYDEDFSLLYKVGTIIQTSYQVGKGMPDPFPDEDDADESVAAGADVKDSPVRPDDAAVRAEPAADDAPDSESSESNDETPIGRIADVGMDGEEEDV